MQPFPQRCLHLFRLGDEAVSLQVNHLEGGGVQPLVVYMLQELNKERSGRTIVRHHILTKMRPLSVVVFPHDAC